MIIGICGPAGSGKDTVADYIARNHKGVKVALADPLKRICKMVFGFTDNQLWGPSSARNEVDLRHQRPGHTFTNSTECACCGNATAPFCYLTCRYALQLLGTEWGRHCLPDVWALEAARVGKALLASSEMAYVNSRGLYMLPETREWTEADRRDANQAKFVLVSDVRFENEMAVIRRNGGKVWRVVPPNWNPSVDTGWRRHASEVEQTALPDSHFDAVIVNAKASFEALHERIEQVMGT